jgi:hypothetical protein
MNASLRLLLLGWLWLTGWQVSAQPLIPLPQAATLAVPLVGQTPPSPTRGVAPGFPALMHTNEGIRRQNQALDADLYLAQKRQAQATIDEAVADVNRRKQPQSAKVLKESDLSGQRKAQRYAALRGYEQVVLS